MEHKKFKVGCHLKAGQLLYEHHGIYIGEGLVVHYAFGGITVGIVEKFTGREIMEEVPHFGSPYAGEEIRKRAFNHLGENRCDLVSNNCEYFANWCYTGEAGSGQVEEAVRLAKTLLLKILEGC